MSLCVPPRVEPLRRRMPRVVDFVRYRGQTQSAGLPPLPGGRLQVVGTPRAEATKAEFQRVWRPAHLAMGW